MAWWRRIAGANGPFWRPLPCFTAAAGLCWRMVYDHNLRSIHCREAPCGQDAGVRLAAIGGGGFGCVRPPGRAEGAARIPPAADMIGNAPCVMLSAIVVLLDPKARTPMPGHRNRASLRSRPWLFAISATGHCLHGDSTEATQSTTWSVDVGHGRRSETTRTSSLREMWCIAPGHLQRTSVPHLWHDD